MNKVYVLLGGNIGNRKKYIAAALRQIEKKLGKVSRTSSLYQTAAWGNTDQPDFLNRVIIVHTDQTAEKCLETCLLIEASLGRVRTFKNAPRTIDIDLLFYNKSIVKQKSLCLPHPALHLRRFVLVPLNELSPNFKHPVLQQTIHQLLIKCKDELNVNKI